MLHGKRGPARNCLRGHRYPLHSGVHARCSVRQCDQQLRAPAGDRDRARRTARSLVSGKRAPVLRLRSRIHRQDGRRGGASRACAAPSTRTENRREAPAGTPAGRPGALEVHRADRLEGPRDQDCPDDREPRLPLYLQLLHRLHGRLPAHGLRPDPGRSPLPPRHREAPACRMARPELRDAFREDDGRDRGRRAAGEDRLRGGKLSLPPVGEAPPAFQEKWFQGTPATRNPNRGARQAWKRSSRSRIT